MKPVTIQAKNDFILRWEAANRDETKKGAILKEYGISHRQARGWADDFRKEVAAAGIVEAPIISEPVYGDPVKDDASSVKHIHVDTSRGIVTAAVIGDIQFPFQDKKTLPVVIRFLVKRQPKILFLNGDILDFYQMSKFDQDPKRIDQLQDDLNEVIEFFTLLRACLPNTQIEFLGGNHEDRLQKYKWSRAKELSSLDALRIENLLKLEDNKINYTPYDNGIMINGVFLVIHGNLVSVNSSYTAKRMYEKHGGCGVCGHSHRGGVYYRRNRFGTWGWWEGFCLCRLDPDYTETPDWQQGFSLIHFTGEKRFSFEPIPIVNHKFMYGGTIYE